jgi:iron complex outermembrane receptor protein
VAYDVNDQIAVYAGVNNFTDQQPAPGSESYPVNALGRYFYVGATTKLGSLFGR